MAAVSAAIGVRMDESDGPYVVNLVSSLTGWGIGVPIAATAISRLIQHHELRWWRDPIVAARRNVGSAWDNLAEVLMPYALPAPVPWRNARMTGISPDVIAAERWHYAQLGLGRVLNDRSIRTARGYLKRAEEGSLDPRLPLGAVRAKEGRDKVARGRRLLTGVAEGPLAQSPIGPPVRALVDDIVRRLDYVVLRVEAQKAEQVTFETLGSVVTKNEEIFGLEVHRHVPLDDVHYSSIYLLRRHLALAELLADVPP